MNTPEVEELSSDQLDEGIQRALDALGLTFDALAKCAETGDFPNERARLVWFMIAPDDRVTC